MSEKVEELQEEEEPRSEVIDELPHVDHRKDALSKGLESRDAESKQSLMDRGILQFRETMYSRMWIMKYNISWFIISEKSGAKQELEKNLTTHKLQNSLQKRSSTEDLRNRVKNI